MKWRKSKSVAPNRSIFPDETARFWLEDAAGNVLTNKGDVACRVTPTTGEVMLIGGSLVVTRRGVINVGRGYFRGIQINSTLGHLRGQIIRPGDTVTLMEPRS